MASYKNRVKELEKALAVINGWATHVDQNRLSDGNVNDKILLLTNHVLKGGTVGTCGLTKTVKNLMSGKPVEIPLDTPLCCDPSSETFWSM